MNQRIPEASGLRRFFQEQWDYLQQLLAKHRREKQQQQTQTELLSEAVECLVDGTDARLRAVAGYQQRLRESTRELLDYIEGLVGAVSPALSISPSSYLHDPLLNTLFDSSQEIHQLFAQNRSVQAFFNDLEHQQEVFILLLAKRKEKNILGAEVQGEMIIKEVRQTSVSFYGHELMAPRMTEASARSALKRLLFDNLVQHLEKQIIQLRYAQTEEEKLAGMLNPLQSINNPEIYLEMLVEQLSQPKKLIKLQDQMLRVSKMGIKLPLDSKVSSNEFRLQEVEIGEETAKVVSIVRYQRNQAQLSESTIKQCWL